MFDCQECIFKGVSSENLKEHVAENHIFGKLFAFIIDENDGSNSTQLQTTFQEEHEKRVKRKRQVNESEQGKINSKYQCDQCKYKTNHPCYLSMHVDAVHKNIVRFKCNVCELKAYQKVAIIEHFRRKHKNGEELNIIALKCDQCDNDVPHENCCRLKRRTKKDGKFKCEITDCFFSSNFKRVLKGHVDSLHLKLKRFACSGCDYKSYHGHNVKSHQQSHNKGEQLEVTYIDCTLCQQKVPHSRHKTHHRNEQDIKKDGKFKCEITDCFFSSNFKQVLKEHVDSLHLKLKRFACSGCDYKSYHGHNVKSHQQYHHKGEQPEVLSIDCSLCQQKVPHSKHKYHHRKEQDIKRDGKFKCQTTDCFYSSNCKKTLKGHVNSLHLKLNRYACSGCDYKSYYSGNVKTHQQTHHKGEHLQVIYIDCSLCEQKVRHLRHRILRNEDDKKKSPKFVEEEEGMKTENVNSKQFTCDIDDCSFATGNKKRLDQHTESFHLNILRYYCNFCEYKSYYNYKVAKHQEKHKDKVVKVLKIGCQKCEDNIDHKSHYKAVLKKYQCKEEGCSFSTNSPKHKIVLRCHTQRIHLQILRYSCNLCDLKKYYKSSIIRHQKLSHKLEEFPKVLKIGTELCYQKRKTSESKNVRESSSVGKFKCNIEDCEYSVNSEQSLKLHLEIFHLKIMKYACNLCDYKSYFKHSIESHINSNIHGEEPKKILRIGCTLCEQDIAHEVHSNAWKVTKSEDGSFKCKVEYCTYATNRKESLTRHHERQHLQLLKYACNLCEYKSFHSSDILKHQNRKHGDNDSRKVLRIGCTFCDQNIEHRRHSNETRREFTSEDRSFKCKVEDCRYTTNIKQRLIWHHERQHLQLLKYACNLCEQKSFVSATILKHQNRKHGDNDLRKVLRIGCTFCDQNLEHFKHSNDTRGRKRGNPQEIIELNGRHSNDSRTEFTSEDRSFKCKVEDCAYSTNIKQSLTRHHEGQHLQLLKYACNLCEQKSIDSYTILCHQNRKHRDNDSRKVLRIGCTFCDQNLEHVKHSNETRGRKRRNPQENVELNGTSKCPHCNSEYSSDRIRSHIDDYHLQMKRFMCGKCDYKSYTRSNIESHIANNHSTGECEVKALKCQECETNQKPHEHQYEILKDNAKERMEKSIKLECDECGLRSFNTNKERIEHYKSDHPGKHIFNCNYCKYGSNYLANVNNHVDSMHEKKEFKCENCSFKTAWKQSFHHHMRLEHGYFQYTTKFNIKGDGQSYLCQDCGYSTFSQSDFKRHKSLSACSMDKRTRILVERQGRPHLRRLPNGLKANEIIRKYKCNKCDYSTDYHSNVRKHVKDAHEPKPEVKLMCDQCDYSSKFRHNLKIHIESKHTISSGFSCPECGKHAPTRNALRAHQKRNHI